MSKGRLIVISGPSGVGKSTVIRKVMEHYERLRFSVSATTRARRESEVEGESYYFVTREQFTDMLAQNAFLEHADYTGDLYGTPEAPVNAMLEQGYDILLDIEPNGALQVRARRPDAILIFLAAPSFQELERRLVNRGDTAPDKVQKRLQTAHWEYTQAPKYDYIVINDEVEHAVNEILAIFTAEACRASERRHYLEEE